MKSRTIQQTLDFMKAKIYFLLLLSLLVGCKDDMGTMKYKNKYTTSIDGLRSASIIPEETYTIFGDYITSITPYHLSSKFAMLYYSDNFKSEHMISYVDGHDNDPRYEIASYADFSANQEVEIDPILYSTDLMDGIFKQKEIDFQFLIFSPTYFMHEFEVPIQYKELALTRSSNIFSNGTVNYDSIQNKLYLRTMTNMSYGAIHGNTNGMRSDFTLVFGNTDSSYVYTYQGVNLSEDKRFPHWDQSGWVIIRSNKYNTLKVRMPEEDQTNTMYSTIGFDTNNLIQVYAGNDNIPYTTDDVFVYAPRFWERLRVKLEVR